MLVTKMPISSLKALIYFRKHTIKMFKSKTISYFIHYDVNNELTALCKMYTEVIASTVVNHRPTDFNLNRGKVMVTSVVTAATFQNETIGYNDIIDQF